MRRAIRAGPAAAFVKRSGEALSAAFHALGHPGVRAYADDALLLWSAARTRSRASEVRLLTRR